MVNRVSSSFPKGGHPGTQTELNDINKHQKQAAESHNRTTALGRSVINYWGAKTSFTSTPSISAVVLLYIE